MKDPLVLLPGMMCDARLFGPQIDALSAGRPILVAPLTGAQTMADLARAVLDIAPGRFALAGLSMGGIVAMEMIRQAPDRVTRLALMDTNPLADPPQLAPVRAAQVDKVRAGGLDIVMRDEMKPNYLADGPHRDRILALCMDMARALGPEAFETQSHAIRDRPDQCDTLRAVAVPTLVLCGAQDRLCPVDRHRLMHDLVPGARLEILPGAGHMPTLEQPDLTNKVLMEWLTP